MNTDIEKCRELVFEIEGLLHVMQQRSLDNLPATVKSLLSKKSAQLAELLQFGVDNSVQAEVETFEAVAEAPAADAAAKKEDEEKLAETVEYEQEEDSEPEAGAPDADTTLLDEAQAEEDEADTEAAETEKAREEYYGEIATKKTAGEALRQFFTVNDRYRYARELFGGSIAAFNNIIDEISTFGSLDEISEYLRDRQGIDTTKGAGKEFLAIVSHIFD